MDLFNIQDILSRVERARQLSASSASDCAASSSSSSSPPPTSSSSPPRKRPCPRPASSSSSPLSPPPPPEPDDPPAPTRLSRPVANLAPPPATATTTTTTPSSPCPSPSSSSASAVHEALREAARRGEEKRRERKRRAEEAVRQAREERDRAVRQKEPLRRAGEPLAVPVELIPRFKSTLRDKVPATIRQKMLKVLMDLLALHVEMESPEDVVAEAVLLEQRAFEDCGGRSAATYKRFVQGAVSELRRTLKG